MPATESEEPGLVVAIPTRPFTLIVRDGTEEVAYVAADEVATKRLAPVLRKVQLAVPATRGSESASCGPVDVAIWSK